MRSSAPHTKGRVCAKAQQWEFQGVFKDSKSRLAKIKGTPIGLGNTRLEKLLEKVL